MKARPVKHYRKPGYPTRLQVISDPDLLRRNLPPGWRSIPGMAGSIALFLAANSVVQGAEKKTAATEKAAIVAPIFDHGEGRGATGCIVVAPPVFLSEEEAWQVINEELVAHGVKLGETNAVLQGVQIPHRLQTTVMTNGKVEGQTTEVQGSAKPFAVDRENQQKRIALEFLSQRDYHSKAGAPSEMSTVSSYDFRQTARSLAKDIQKQAQEKIYLGVLYDPLAKTPDLSTLKTRPQESWIKAYRAMQQEASNESKRLLRLQVQDFLKWLEAQGAI